MFTIPKPVATQVNPPARNPTIIYPGRGEENTHPMAKYKKAALKAYGPVRAELRNNNYRTFREDAAALDRVKVSEILYSVQVNNNGVAVICAIVSVYSISDYVHHNFPQAGGFYYDTPRPLPMPGGDNYYSPP